MATREEILRQTQMPTRSVPTPEWGAGTAVTVRALTGKERDAWENQNVLLGTQATANIRARLVVMAAVDDAGELLFSAEDAIQLGETGAAPLDRLFDAVCDLSGMGEPKLRTLRKNLSAGRSAGSSSGSPST